MEKRYINLSYGTLDIQVKLDDDGVVIDVFDETDEVVVTTYKTYEEFDIKTIKFNK